MYLYEKIYWSKLVKCNIVDEYTKDSYKQFSQLINYFTQPLIILSFFLFLSYEVASGTDITSCIKIDKPLLLHKKPCHTLLTAMLEPAKTFVLIRQFT